MYKYTFGREQDASYPTEFSSLFEHLFSCNFITSTGMSMSRPPHLCDLPSNPWVAYLLRTHTCRWINPYPSIRVWVSAGTGTGVYGNTHRLPVVNTRETVRTAGLPPPVWTVAYDPQVAGMGVCGYGCEWKCKGRQMHPQPITFATAQH